MVLQDNESAILLEKNGRRSSSKRTRHIEIRYFFVTDNVKRGRMRIEHCPTGDMVADFFTKPLQGAAFKKMLKSIMNISDDLIVSSPQECVGDEKNAHPTTEEIQPASDHASQDETVGLGARGSRMAKDLPKSYADVVKSEKVTSVTFSRK